MLSRTEPSATTPVPDTTEGVAPPGWEETVRRMKRAGTVKNPFALAWWMRRKHFTPHRDTTEATDEIFASTMALAERLMHLELVAQAPAEAPGAVVRWRAEEILETGQKASKAAFLYAEKPDGFQCGTCRYALAANATHGHCALLDGTIHLSRGCCAGWEADLAQLQTHREF